MLPLIFSDKTGSVFLCKNSCIERKLTVRFTSLTIAKVYSILPRAVKGSPGQGILVLSFPMLVIQTQTLSRAEALRRIRLLSGKDLRPLADQYGITVWKNGRKNKGWAGQVIEHYLGLPQNSLQAPDFGTWEL
jgi:hypothetical protein